MKGKTRHNLGKYFLFYCIIYYENTTVEILLLLNKKENVTEVAD